MDYCIDWINKLLSRGYDKKYFIEFVTDKINRNNNRFLLSDETYDGIKNILKNNKIPAKEKWKYIVCMILEDLKIDQKLVI